MKTALQAKDAGAPFATPRRIIAALLLAALAILTTSCEKPDDTFRVLWKAGRTPGALLTQFGERPGIKLAVETYASDADLIEKLSAKGAAYDLLETDDRIARELAENGLLRKLDKSKIPNLANLDPAFSRPPFDADGKYSVPYMTEIIGITYNAETVALPIIGFSSAFHPQYAGRIAGGDDPLELAAAAMLASGLPLDGLKDGDISKITPLLANWLSKMSTPLFSDPAAALLQGKADIGIIRSGDAARLFATDPKFQWVLPAEGLRLTASVLSVPKTVRHPDTAHELINFLLTPENGLKISEEQPGYNPNAAARALLTEAQRENPASYPTGFNPTQAALFPALGDNAKKIRNKILSLKSP